jgi:hypothetical protein
MSVNYANNRWRRRLFAWLCIGESTVIRDSEGMCHVAFSFLDYEFTAMLLVRTTGDNRYCSQTCAHLSP